MTSEKAKAKKTDESKNALSKETKTEWSFKWFVFDQFIKLQINSYL